MEKTRQNADQIRAACKASFAEFFRLAWPTLEPDQKLVWNWHLQAQCDHMQAIAEGRLHPRLIDNISPGSSKSMIISVMFNAWLWGPHGRPGAKVLSTSYEIDNVTRDINKLRLLLKSEWYQSLWPMTFRQDRADYIENDKLGVRQGAAFSSLTGKRADFLLIDDPHSVDGAESEVERDKAVRRFLEGGQNRLNNQEKSAIIIVMQRVHESDLTGALLARELGYIHLMLPMEFEVDRRCITPIFSDPRTYEGELMDPVRMPRHVYELLVKDNEYMRAGQYQQRPAPREGGMFKIDKILPAENVPGQARHARGWDIAGSTKKKSPFTAGAELAYHDGIVYICDMRRERKEIDQAEALIVNTCAGDHQRYGNRIIQSLPQDPGQSGKSQKRHLAKRLAAKKVNFKFTPETGSKEDRAIPFATMVNAGQVRMLPGPWNKPLLDELGMFPGSAFKDQVDALSRAYAELIPYMGDDEDMVAGPMIVRVDD